jgi:hypothetical protein
MLQMLQVFWCNITVGVGPLCQVGMARHRSPPGTLERVQQLVQG